MGKLFGFQGGYSEEKKVDLYKVNLDVKRRTLIDPIYILKDSAHKNELYRWWFETMLYL